MRKTDLVDLRVDMATVLEEINAIEASDAYWDVDTGDLPADLPGLGRLRLKLFALSQTIIRAKRMPYEARRQ